MNLRVMSDEWRVTSDRQGASSHTPRVTRRRAAFTLVEVMVALGIFFMAMFTILGLVSNSLRNARALQRKTVGCGMVAAQLSLLAQPA